MDNSNTPPQHIKMSQPATPCHKRGIKRTFKQRKSPHNQQIHQQQQQYFDDLSDSESDIPTDYIDNMLEEGLRESLDKSALPSHEERKKIVLKKREQDYFEMLPENWIEITHLSGMPVYLHKLSRVCTLAKPYYLGSGSSRKHEIPISAIPCLAYRRELAKEKECIVKGTCPAGGEVAKKDEPMNDDTLERPTGELTSEPTSEKGDDQDGEKDNEMQISSTVDSSSCPLNHSNNEKQSAGHPEKEDSVMMDTQEVESQLNDLVTATAESLTNDSRLECDVPEKTADILTVVPVDNGQQASNNKKPSFIAKVETVKDNKKERSLNYTRVREYCENLFEFQEITIRKFKTWADRKNHMQQRKLAQRPSLPEGTKLITCPLPVNKEQGPETQGRNMRKEFVMNPAGKSSVCILHEFVQHAERVQPKYVFQELENANTPYSATVIINNMQYGTGYGSSKKQAKSEAAKVTLEILIPDMKEMSQSGGGNKKPDLETNDLSFFDDIKVNDPRVSELCAKAGQHSPYQILVECLRRNNGMGDTDIETNVRLVKHQKNEFTMKVGKHVKTVICRNKREGKQHAAQAILQELHPQIQNWGSLLRLYGRGSCKTPKEKKEEEQKITELQNTACANKPNYAILNKLREEMLKLKEENDRPNFNLFSGLSNTENEPHLDSLLNLEQTTNETSQS